MKTKFEELFPTFKLSGDTLYITMDGEVAKKLSTKEALKMSRMKFEKALELIDDENPMADLEPEFGVRTCPLCSKFFRWKSENGFICDGCPIKKFTGRNGCEGTPYNQIADIDTQTVGDYRVAIANEIAFLKSLEH